MLDRVVPDATHSDDLEIVSATEVDLAAGRVDRWVASSVPRGVRARALVLAGDPLAARTVLDGAVLDGPVLDGREAGRLASPWGAQDLVSTIWAASRVGASRSLRDAARRSLDRLDPAPVGPTTGEQPAMVHEGGVVVGPMPLFLALLESIDGRADRALDLARRAVELGDRRAPYWGAWARLELARLAAGARDVSAADDGHVADLDREASACLGAATLFFRSAGHDHMALRCSELDRPPPLVACAAPGLGHLVRDGDRWWVGVGVQPAVAVAHSSGLEALAHLIDQRGRVVPAVEIAAVLDGSDRWDRLVAETGDDPAAFAEQVRDERARSRVAKLLRRTIESLSAQHAGLGAHLRTRVQTGYVCEYRDDSTRWRR